MIEVVGLGQCCIDYLTLIEDYPSENQKIEFDRLLIQGGGPVATALVCLSRLGRRTALIGQVGDDAFGPLIRQGLVQEGVDVTHLQTVAKGGSQFAFILANPSRASRTIFWTRGSAGALQPKDLPAGLIKEARVLHLDGLMAEASLAAARLARQAKTAVVVDAGTLRPHSLKLAALVDHLLVSEVFAQAFAPGLPAEETVRKLKGLGPQTAVVSLGARGAVGWDGRSLVRWPAYRVEAIDTTGAGDAFHGGYIHALLAGWDLKDRLRWASAVAALNCTALGGRTALPDQETVREFIRNNPGP
ncbi:MAG: sugar kinase [Deltaproteobacteria bacterium]|nr:sugar kinase [Deltaproteobacteria bacterium]